MPVMELPPNAPFETSHVPPLAVDRATPWLVVAAKIVLPICVNPNTPCASVVASVQVSPSSVDRRMPRDAPSSTIEPDAKQLLPVLSNWVLMCDHVSPLSEERNTPDAAVMANT